MFTRRAVFCTSLCRVILFAGLMLTAVFAGADSTPQRLVGQWVRFAPLNSNLKMVYEFHSDGTVVQYYTMAGPSDYSRSFLTRSIGSYRFQKNFLTYRMTTVTSKGKTSKPTGASAGVQKYKALLVGDQLRLTRILAGHDGPVSAYTRQ